MVLLKKVLVIFLESVIIFFFDSEFSKFKDKNSYLSLSFRNIFRLIMLLRFISFFLYGRLTNLNVYKFVTLIKNFDYKKLKNKLLVEANFNDIFLISKPNFFSNKVLNTETVNRVGEKVRFLFLFFVITKLANDINLNLLVKNKLDYKFIKILFIDITFGSMFFYLGNFLSSLFSKFILSCNFNFKINFYMLKNEQVTAKFLSRYITRKLQQGYSIKNVVNPIKKDLKRVSLFLNPLHIVSKKYLVEKDQEQFWLNNIYSKGLFIRLLSFLISIFRLEFCKFYILNHCWINFDYLMLSY